MEALGISIGPDCVSCLVGRRFILRMEIRACISLETEQNLGPFTR